MVPAGPAGDLGWDRSLVGGYGQDYRSCAYAALAALLDVKEPEHTSLALSHDKEEIGRGQHRGQELPGDESSSCFERQEQGTGPAPGAGAAGLCPPTSPGPWTRT